MKFLKNLKDWVSMRDSNGRFVKGEHASVATEFKPGQHWRERKPHWDAEWLREHYIDKALSAQEIALLCGVTGAAIIYHLKKNGIERRSTSEARLVKHWGASGEDNPMYGRTGEANQIYKDGSRP
jgi:hypothetical protein